MNTLEDMFSDEEVPEKKVETIIPRSQQREPGEIGAKDVIDNEYRGYAMYTIQNRAIPSVIDGFKPVQRKLFYAMRQNGGRKIKAAEVGGSLSSYGYGHGEASAQAAIIKMAQDWNNNIPVFIGHGNFGTRLIQSAAAPRYIYVSSNPITESIFVDNDVLDKNSDPEDVEPHHYLPLIPWVLLNGISGIAVGFATDILPRSAKDLVAAVTQYCSGKPITNPLLPTFPGFKGKTTKLEDGRYQTTGIIEPGKRNSYVISELPWGYDRESYFNLLVEMSEDGKINSFDDHCDSTGFNFIVKMNPEQRSAAEKDLIKYFKLTKTHSENYTCIDEKGKLIIFSHVHDVIKYFCDYRVKKKRQQIDFDIAKMTSEKDFLDAKKIVIQGYIDIGTGEISKWNMKQFKDFIKERVSKDEYIEPISRLPIHSVTLEKVAELEEEITKLSGKIDVARKLDEKVVYMKEVAFLKV